MDEKPKNKGGRPRKYTSPEKFDSAVNAYVKKCRDEKEPITWTGMALSLGFTSRQAIDVYQDYDGFYDSIKRAKLIVENAYERRLHGNNPSGAIFALKNMEWSDKQELDHRSSDGSMSPKRELTREDMERELEKRGLPKNLLDR